MSTATTTRHASRETGRVVGRRERKKQETRTALSEAAVALSLEHGVEHVTIEQISDAADVSLRTFFNYFSSKEEAVVAGDSARGDVLVDLVRERPASESVLEALRHAVLAHVDDLAGDDRMDALRMMRKSPTLLPHQLAAYADRERELGVVIAERLGERVPDDGSVGLRAALLAATSMAGVRVAMQRWTDGGSRDRDRLRASLDEVFDQLAALGS
ncbi:TetR/AcrR family transcriptional regulator [Actinomycetospora termitidis]|uniref:TetR/AcrR family transcriptional regulator n=1 Tax=Actinomycetospora termitidis TaxID=3053470 RepID=A0ABT7MF67_9PSEU|nr:TetR/AcrR family transcriptional regulator [Actinomycetospora sp. Odt1-22]MDL5159309.1 TetR/AcrR family transcriptional regulator [Actinomycetospora sp. Odt1-22]